MTKPFAVTLSVLGIGALGAVLASCSTGGGGLACGVPHPTTGVATPCPGDGAAGAMNSSDAGMMGSSGAGGVASLDSGVMSSLDAGPVQLPANDAEQTFNTLIQTSYPTGRPAMLPPGPAVEPGRVPTAVLPGQLVTISPPQAGAEVCVAFGNPNNGWCVPTEDTANGALELTLPADICDTIDVASVCHDIRCYESATVDGQNFTQTSVQPLLAACGGCDEPSCAPLLDSGVCECATEIDCEEGKVCSEGACVVEGVLRFSARWDTQLDIDLYVTDPSGETLSYGNSTVESGGALDRDDTSGGPGTIENAAWPVTAPAGTYIYWVQNFRGGDAGPIVLTVFEEGVEQISQTVTVGMLSGDASTALTYTYGP